jgi:ribonuclease P protein component
MLPKSQRLNLKKDFSFVIQGKKTETPSMRLMYRVGENEIALVGIALAKKNFRKAVARNKVKRKASDAIQVHYERLRKDLNLVIMPKPEILKKRTEELTKELESVKDLYLAD